MDESEPHRSEAELIAEIHALRAELSDLKRSEALLRAVVDGIDDSVFVKDERGRYLLVNPAAARVMGRSRAEVLGRCDEEFFIPETAHRVRDDDRGIMARGEIRVFQESTTLTGVRRTFLTTKVPHREDSGRVIGVIGISREITERVRAEEALEASERRFRLVLENSRDVIYQLDIASRGYDYVSPSARDVLGHSSEEFIAGGLAVIISLIHPEDLQRLDGQLSDLLDRRPGSGLDTLLEYRVKVPDKGWRWMSDRATVIRDRDRRPVAIVGNVRDVTEMRTAGERLRDLSRRLIRAQEEERRHIARELHDEIGQAISAVIMNLRWVLLDLSSPSAPPRLEDSIELLVRTTGQVRDIALDLRPSLLDHLGLVAALRSYVAAFGQRSGVESRFVVEEAGGSLPPEVETACYRIVQEALTNVARHASAGLVRVELVRSDGELRLSVADDGRGFDVEAATARSASGSSLGVLGMRERAVLVGGRLEIASEPGLGTQIRATFPLVEPPAPDGDPTRVGTDVAPDLNP